MQITITEQKASITMDTELARMIEQAAKEADITTEEFLASGTMEKMEELFPE